MKDRMKNMSANHKIQKTTGGVVHTGSWKGNEADPKTSKYGYFTPSCGSGVVYAMGSLRNIAGFREAKAEAEITCKKCIKLLAKLAETTPEPVEEAPVKDEVVTAPEIKPGRCLQRVAKVGKTPTQCVKGHAHEDDHEDRFGQSFPNHAIVPGAEPLSPTAQALADASKARDDAAREYSEAKTPAQRAEAEEKYEAASALRWEAVNAHRKAREAAGDFGPRAGREARAELARLNAPKGTSPLAKRLADDHGLNFF